jgi:hypothetical protein
VSAFFYTSPANRVTIIGELRPKSKFLGNSVSTTMEGENRVVLGGRPQDGEYVISMPNMYARGILFGKMVLELGDTCVARNDALGISADIEFKTKVRLPPPPRARSPPDARAQGFFTGTYNQIGGKVKSKSGELGSLDGKWSGAMEFRPTKGGAPRVLFDAARDGAKLAATRVAPEAEQEPNESRRLWAALTAALGRRDQDAAQEAKSAVEDRERELRKKADGKPHVPRFFEQRAGRWEPKLTSVPALLFLHVCTLTSSAACPRTRKKPRRP